MVSELAALVAEFDCSKTLEVGHRGGSSVLAGLLHRVQFIAGSAEVALPELLRGGTEIDFALIHGPKRFEDTFVEFFYLDRMLVNGGILALAGAEEREVSTVVEFVLEARAYELRSEASAHLAVLRKLGRHRPQATPFPSHWARPGVRASRDRNLATETGAVISGVVDLPVAAVENGASRATSTRALHLARARADELEARVVELGTRLLEAEQRAAELLRTRARLGGVELELRQTQDEIGELRSRLSLSEGAHQRAEYWLACVNASASWRLTAPLRSVKKRAPPRFGR